MSKIKLYRLIFVSLVTGFSLTVSADEFAGADNPSRAADLAQQANAQLQEASSPQDFSAAAALFEKSLALNPDNPDAQKTLGWIYLDQLRQPKKAYPHLEIFERARPGDVDARKLFGMACFQTGRSGKAVEEFTAAAQLQPKDLWIRASLGRSLARTGKTREAKEMFIQILQTDPHNATALLGMAEIEAWHGHDGAALKILDQLIQEDPDNLEALALRADIRRWSWNLSGAKQDYRQVLKEDPTDGSAVSGLEQARRIGESDVSVSAYQFKDTTDFLREYLEADGRLHLDDRAYLLAGVDGWRFTNPGFPDLNRGDASAGLEYHFARWLQATVEGDAYHYDNQDPFYGGHFTSQISLMPGTDVFITGALRQPYVWDMLTVEEAMRQNIIGAGLDTKLVGRLSFQLQAQGATLSDNNSWWEATPQLSYRLLNAPQTFIRVQGDYLSYSEIRTNYWTPQQRYTVGPVFDTSIPIFKGFHLEGDAKAPYVFDEQRLGYELQGGPVFDLFNHVKASATYYYSHIPGDLGEWSGHGWRASLQISF